MLPGKTKIKWDMLEDQLINIIQSLKNLKPDALAFRISDDKWTILQILQHLVLSEKLSMIYLAKKWKYSQDLPQKTPVTLFRSWALLLSMWSPIPLKAPARVNVFDQDKTSEEIISEWQLIRSEMKDFLEKLPVTVFDKEFYKHPAVGKLTLDHMLEFFYAHCKRHHKQILKIIEYQKIRIDTI